MNKLIRYHRDTRIDFFRGVALWSIFIDHLNRSWLRVLTLKQMAFCDAAELFVLLAGVSAGMVYGPTVVQQGTWVATRKVLRRVLVLYRTHLMVFMLFAAEATILSARFQRHEFLKLFYFEPLETHPYRSLLEAVLLRWQPQYMDILPLYVILLLMFCFALPLLRKPRLLLSVSIALYGASRVLHLGMPVWQHPWYFNPFAWQLLFVIGVVARTWHWTRQASKGWDVVALGLILFGAVESHARQLVGHVPGALLINMDSVDKTGLHPFRLTSILAFAWLASRYVPVTAKWLQSRPAKLFVLMGQHSLPVFCAGLFVALLGQFIMFANAGLLSQILVQGLGTLSLLLVAALYASEHKSTRQHASPVVIPEVPAEVKQALVAV